MNSTAVAVVCRPIRAGTFISLVLANPLKPRPRMETLEARRVLDGITGTVGQPLNDVLVAHNIELPANASGMTMIEIDWSDGVTSYPNGDSDGFRVEQHADGTFDVFGSHVPTRSGDETTKISYRNSDTGRWDVLTETPTHIEPAKLDSPGYASMYKLPGIPFPGSIAKFPIRDGVSLDESKLYATVDWDDGTPVTAADVKIADGHVFVNPHRVLPDDFTYQGQGVLVKVFEGDQTLGATYVDLYAYAHQPLGATSDGVNEAGTLTMSFDSSDWNGEPYMPVVHGYKPAAEISGIGTSTWSVKVWNHDNRAGAIQGTLTRDADGTNHITVNGVTDEWDDGQLEIKETYVAPDGTTTNYNYIGSWDLVKNQSPPPTPGADWEIVPPGTTIDSTSAISGSYEVIANSDGTTGSTYFIRAAIGPSFDAQGPSIPAILLGDTAASANSAGDSSSAAPIAGVQALPDAAAGKAAPVYSLAAPVEVRSVIAGADDDDVLN